MSVAVDRLLEALKARGLSVRQGDRGPVIHGDKSKVSEALMKVLSLNRQEVCERLGIEDRNGLVEHEQIRTVNGCAAEAIGFWPDGHDGRITTCRCGIKLCESCEWRLSGCPRCGRTRVI